MILKFMRWIKRPCFRNVAVDKNDHYYVVQSGGSSAYV